MKEAKISVSGEMTFQFDPESDEFQYALQCFRRNMCDESLNALDMLEHVAFHINRFGVETLVEGVGHVAYAGKPEVEDFSGITYSGALPDTDFSYKAEGIKEVGA